MTVRQLLKSMDSRELSEWMAYFQIESEDLKTMKQGTGKQESLDDRLKGAFSVMSAKGDK